MRKNILRFSVFPIMIAMLVCLLAGCGGAASTDKMAEGNYQSAPMATTAAAAMGGNFYYADDMEHSVTTEGESGSIFVPAD